MVCDLHIGSLHSILTAHQDLAPSVGRAALLRRPNNRAEQQFSPTLDGRRFSGRCLPGSQNKRWIHRWLASALSGWIGLASLGAQSADWQQVIWREPQVRYLLADMTLGGKVNLYRDYAAREKDPDLPYPETNVRYFMVDIALGGGVEFYRAAAERDHEMGCLEAVRRTEEGFVILNLDQFERKRVNGEMRITRKGGDARISGLDVRLSSD